MFARTSRISVASLLPKRQVHTNDSILDSGIEVKNRNPRNLERLRIARKPNGYHLEVPLHSYWHKLEIKKFTRHIVADVIHFENGPVITVSSQEWGLKYQLYSAIDRSAYINVGRVLAERCLKSGICEMNFYQDTTDKPNLQLLISEIQKEGIQLQEPERYLHPHPWHWERPEKPWETHE